jgi:hypothetical protein
MRYGSSGSVRTHTRGVNGEYRFYEKVVKVKDDVAAILNSFPRAIIFALGRPAGGCTSAEANPGGWRKGGFSGAL